jgi:hypothetical protein
MLTNYNPSEIEELNKKLAPEQWEPITFQVIDEDNNVHENIPGKSLWVDRRYEVVTYPSGRKGVQLLGGCIETVLLREPETEEGKKQALRLNMRVEV